MYALYSTNRQGDSVQFSLLRRSSIAGNKSGIVVRYLRTVVGPEDSEPFRWHLPMAEALSSLHSGSDAFVIDLKPDQSELVTLFEVTDIWGYSDSGWTPILLRLRELIVDESSKHHRKRLFFVEDYDSKRLVHTFLYLSGTVRRGQITGTWNFPGPSPTNSVLLWPRTYRYFRDRIEEGLT